MNYSLRLTVITLLLAVSSLSAATHYVSMLSANPTPPYTNWATAATSIQDAVGAAAAGDVVVVTNGVYAGCVSVISPLTLLSVKGPQSTIIAGGGTNRCATLNDGASLTGFTLTNGFCSGGQGAGVWCASTNAFLTNCVIAGNLASSYEQSEGFYVYLGEGGGACGGTLYNCTLTRNLAVSGGGAYFSTLYNCTLTDNYVEYWVSPWPVLMINPAAGGGADYCTLYNCTLTDNSATDAGGGVSASTLYNCTLTGNSALGSPGGYPGKGGGAYFSTLYHCTLTGNWANLGGGVSGGTLYNCTLAGNSAYAGGGAYGGTLNCCALTGNSASSVGGGAYGGTLNACVLTGNSASSVGGGAGWSTLTNCTLTGNVSTAMGSVGGAYYCALYNCILYFNTALNGANYDVSSDLNYCCTTPLPAGTGNIDLDPQLVSTSHLSPGSPCRGAGSAAYAAGTDIDGEPWGGPPSIGCDEYHAGAVTGFLSVAILAPYTNVTVGYTLGLTAAIEGRAAASVWDFGDGLVASNWPCPTHAWSTVGDYAVVLRAYNESHPEGVAGSLMVHVTPTAYYVLAGNPNPVAPYTNWATAAQTIQDAVDADVIPGAIVLVGDGHYSTGGRAVGNSSNRVAITKPLAVRSVNGPQFTIVDGGRSNRCVFLTNGASLSGFTLTNGYAVSGGGVWCTSTYAALTNCTLAGNIAARPFPFVIADGGGAYSGTLCNCTLTENVAVTGGGASGSTLYNCTLTRNWVARDSQDNGGIGGGVVSSTLYNCILNGNMADASGFGGGAVASTLYNCTLSGHSSGGADYCTLYNCTLSGNSGRGAYRSTLYNCTLRRNSGSGAIDSTLYNCTLTGNSASGGGGGANGSTLSNCIVYYNTASSGGANYGNSTLNYCCTTPLPTSGVGNITSAPLFVDYTNGNLRLLSNSPCINAGNNSDLTNNVINPPDLTQAWFTNLFDLDGRPRLVGGTVDMGAYEYQPGVSGGFIGWLQGYALPTDGSADYADPDQDGLNNWQEWVCGTAPTNRLSALRLLSAAPAGANVTVSWQSAAGVNYFLERSGNLAAPFTLLATNILGQAGTSTYADTNAAGVGPLFYRVGVQ